MTEKADPDLLPLYIPLYFDEDVSAGVVQNLRLRGFDVIKAGAMRHLGLDDESQLAFAVSEKRALVTHNRRDFEVLHERYLEAGRTHYGVIIARRRPLDAAVVSRLLTLLDAVTAEQMINQLRHI